MPPIIASVWWIEMTLDQTGDRRAREGIELEISELSSEILPIDWAS